MNNLKHKGNILVVFGVLLAILSFYLVQYSENAAQDKNKALVLELHQQVASYLFALDLYGTTFCAVDGDVDEGDIFPAFTSTTWKPPFHANTRFSIDRATGKRSISLTFANRHPEKVETVISVASGFKTTVLNRLILFEQILAIENDRNFCGGDYYEGEAPDYGLALARMVSHKTFVHLDAIERRAGQSVRQDSAALDWYKVRDPFQSYMLHQGKKFVKRFDANTYLRIIDMWSRYDAVAEADKQSVEELFQPSREHGHRYLVFSIDSDFCFYPEEQAELVGHLEAAEVDCMHITVHSDKGHDSFLLEPHLYAPHIGYLLND